jgi:TolA-binding protein
MRRLFMLVLTLIVAASCGPKVPPADQLMQQAETYYKDRKLVEALDQFRLFVSHYPKDEQAARCSFMVGFIYANDFKDTLRARESYEAFLKDYPAADEGLRQSAQWELEHLGQDVSNLPFLEE